MNLGEGLKIAGLNASEVKVYLFLLENGICSPPIVSRGTNIARTNCYNILSQLKSKGLVDVDPKARRTTYLAKSPTALIRNMEMRQEVIKELLPDLEAMYSTNKNRPKIRFFEGVQDIEKLLIQSLKSNTINIIGSLDKLANITTVYQDYYLKEINQRGIILNKALEIDSGSSILQWDNNVLFLTFTEPPSATLINNNPIATLIKALCEQKIK